MPRTVLLLDISEYDSSQQVKNTRDTITTCNNMLTKLTQKNFYIQNTTPGTEVKRWVRTEDRAIFLLTFDMHKNQNNHDLNEVQRIVIISIDFAEGQCLRRNT